MFDFDELEVAGPAQGKREREVVRDEPKGQGDPDQDTGNDYVINADVGAPAQDERGGGNGISSTGGDALQPRPSGPKKKPISRARAWFEIRRFFEAEPQKHYNSPDKNEWKTYYAKEMILKTTCEKLQQDGFVVIDAWLAPEYFKKLAQELLLDAPEQAAALQDHLGAVGNLPRAQAIGWVGSREQELREQQLRERALQAREKALCDLDPAIAALPLGAPSPAGGGGGGGAESTAPHDRALCESCLLSLAPDRQASSALRPQSKQQFFRLMKTYMQVVAENSMSPDKVRQELKIPVQFCFGNMPPPRAALTAPPPPRVVSALEDQTSALPIEVD